ncbi:MAG: RNA polymerase II C-terminal domain phosphatase-like 4 [Terrestrivirus sp.]|uniref:protein-serine/threonine phosphatase n=1 Tax=Terrestrivirus sp. TaxID=2487775 RepID=A0A3G4ZLA4_9VIRU|nr:MAG: RNA polymerase II C-terminal domain phosphatase-like 4 [Terrestrivirus sp.]
MNIILDLDETLIYSIEMAALSSIAGSNYIEDLKKSPHFLMEDECKFIDHNGKVINNPLRYLVFLRPHLLEFLKFLIPRFNIYISTHGVETYAKSIVEKLIGAIKDQQLDLKISGIQYRENYFGTCHQKSLKYFNLSLSNTIIIDDRTDVWEECCKQNIIKIKKYYGPADEGYTDNELLIIISQLKNIQKFCTKKSLITIPELLSYSSSYINNNYSNYNNDKWNIYNNDLYTQNQCDSFYSTKQVLNKNSEHTILKYVLMSTIIIIVINFYLSNYFLKN